MYARAALMLFTTMAAVTQPSSVTALGVGGRGKFTREDLEVFKATKGLTEEIDKGATPLQVAALLCTLESNQATCMTGMQKAIKRYKPSLDETDDQGMTALMRVCSTQHEPGYNIRHAFTELLAAGANPFLFDEQGLSAAHYCAMRGYQRELAILIEKGVSIDDHEASSKLTPLTAAVQFAQNGTATALLERGANVHHIAADGGGVIHHAMKGVVRSGGNLACLRTVLNFGGFINAVMTSTPIKTPLDIFLDEITTHPLPPAEYQKVLQFCSLHGAQSTRGAIERKVNPKGHVSYHFNTQAEPSYKPVDPKTFSRLMGFSVLADGTIRSRSNTDNETNRAPA